jgi:hypothetical protein
MNSRAGSEKVEVEFLSGPAEIFVSFVLFVVRTSFSYNDPGEAQRPGTPPRLKQRCRETWDGQN